MIIILGVHYTHIIGKKQWEAGREERKSLREKKKKKDEEQWALRMEKEIRIKQRALSRKHRHEVTAYDRNEIDTTREQLMLEANYRGREVSTLPLITASFQCIHTHTKFVPNLVI